jgi:serine/threonine-protein kinase
MIMVERIGRYEVQAEIGRGGFGRVFRAFDPTVGRQVAIKTLHAGGDHELLVRFRNEAAAAGKLRHHNIVIIHDYGEQGGEPYIVMELLDGEDLQRVIHSRRQLTLIQKLEIMRQGAEGLGHAHENGVVHRDVKPANMMLLPDRNLKIMDFGIAFVNQLAGTRLTKTGAVPGTLKYMAPEQFQGASNDALSDIFSFGVTSYELISGHHPFDGPTQPSVMFNIMQGEPRSLREILAECPEALDQVVLRCLSKQRDLRYSAFTELLLDLRPILIDLQQDQARALFSKAERLVAAGNPEEAQTLLRQGLELDPSNRTGRRLQQSLQREAARPRVEALVSIGRQLLDSGQFSDAISSFEAALKLDRSNQDVISLIARARTTQQQVAEARKLSLEASIALSRRELTRANQLLDQALAADPAHPDAPHLMGELRDQLARREEETRAAKLVQDRNNRIESVINESTTLLNGGDISGAIQRLEAMQQEAPDAAAVQKLLNSARERRDNRKRQETIDRLVREVDGLVVERRFERAIEMLQIGLTYFPGDATIEKRLAATKVASASYSRDQKRQSALGHARHLREQARLADALELIKKFRSEFGADVEVDRLYSEIEKELLPPPVRADRIPAAPPPAAPKPDPRFATAPMPAVIKPLPPPAPAKPKAPRIAFVGTVAAGVLAAAAGTALFVRSDSKPAERQKPETTVTRVVEPRKVAPAESKSVPVVMPPAPAPTERDIRNVPASQTTTGAVPANAKISSATLTIRGGLAGTQIRIGSSVIGTVDSGGNLTASVPPGDQTLELSKDQFQSRKLVRRFSLGKSVALIPGDVVLTAVIDPQAAIAQEWDRLKTSKDVAQVEAFSRANRNSPLAKAADDRVHELRWEAVDKKNIAAIREYTGKYPNGPFTSAAQETVAQLEWSALDKNNVKALQEFRQRYPQGDLASRAARELDRLDQKAAAERAAIEDHQQAEKKGDRDAVLRALGRFTASIAQKDLAGMAATYPGLPKDTWRQAFSRARSISMTLRPLGDPQVNGSSAIVECEQSTRTASGGQEVNSPTRKVRVSLAKNGAAWSILHIE